MRSPGRLDQEGYALHSPTSCSCRSRSRRGGSTRASPIRAGSVQGSVGQSGHDGSAGATRRDRARFGSTGVLPSGRHQRCPAFHRFLDLAIEGAARCRPRLSPSPPGLRRRG